MMKRNKKKLDNWKMHLAATEHYLDHLEADAGNVTDGVSLSTESRHQDLVVLLDVVEAAVTRHEGGDLLSVLDQLDTDALANGRVGLFRLDADFLQDDAL